MVTMCSMNIAPPSHADDHQALAAHQAHRQSREERLDAAERQDGARRQHREPEAAFADVRELTEQLQTRARTAAEPRGGL